MVSWRVGGFAVVAAVFLAVRLPLLGRLPAAMDEDFYAVPASAILRAGVPQIPYLPARDSSSVFDHADRMLYTLPPLAFYAQAALMGVAGDGLGVSRLASVGWGLVAAFVVWRLATRWLGDFAAIVTVAFLMFSRPFWITATTARPDMAAIALGLGAVELVVRGGPGWWARSLGAGAVAGLGLLCHPIGAIGAAQAGLVLLMTRDGGGWRFVRAAGFALVAVMVVAAWLPLIARHPEWFRSQFLGNIGGRAGLGLVVAPMKLAAAIRFQAWNFVEHVGLFQAIAFGAGAIWAAIEARRAGPGRTYALHLAAVVVLYVLVVGDHHIRTYYAYPAAIGSLGVGGVAAWGTRWLSRPRAMIAATAGLVLMLAPGAGVRVLVEHVRRWEDPNYDARRFCRLILEDLPLDAAIAVDRPYVLEFHLAGRRVVEALTDPFYFDVRTVRYDYAVLGRIGLEQSRSAIDGLELIRSYGDRADPLSNYAEVYARPSGRVPVE